MTEEIRSGNELEKHLNKDLNGIIEKLRMEVPKMKDKDIALYCMLVAGFSQNLIANMTDTSLNSIYIRKSRIKSMIQKEAPEHATEFLTAIQ